MLIYVWLASQGFNSTINIWERFKLCPCLLLFMRREPPSTNRHWQNERNFNFDVFSDPTLTVSTAIVGPPIDLAKYLKGSRSAHMHTYMVPKSAVVVISGDGILLSKYTAESPGVYKSQNVINTMQCRLRRFVLFHPLRVAFRRGVTVCE